MKKYQRVLGWIGKALKIIIIILTLGAGWIGGNKLFDHIKANQATRKIVAAQCLDNGGRIADIDGITDCFELTLAEVRRDDCGKDPKTIFLHHLGDVHVDECYTFERIVQEN